jgi:hypothetical protein
MSLRRIGVLLQKELVQMLLNSRHIPPIQLLLIQTRLILLLKEPFGMVKHYINYIRKPILHGNGMLKS